MYTGILISDKSIKACKIEGKKPRFVKVPLEDGILVDGVIKDEEKFNVKLLQLARQLNLHKTEVVLSISEKHIFSKTITITDNEVDFEVKIAEELETYVSAEAPSYNDWQILEKKEETQKVFVATAPALLLDSYVAAFRHIGVSVVGVQPVPCAIARHIPPFIPTKPSASNAAEASSGVAKKQVAAKPSIDTIQQVPQAPNSLVIVFEEIEILLMIVNANNQIELTSVLPVETVGQHGDLLSEISEMRSFYERKKKGEPISRVLLTGEGATEDLKNQLATNMAVPSEFLQIRGISAQEGISFFPVFALVDFSVAVPKDHKHINLLPEGELFVYEKDRKAKDFTRLIATTTIFFATLCFLYACILGFFLLDIAGTSQEIDKLGDTIKSSGTEKIRADINDINTKVHIVKRLTEKEETILSVFTFLAEKTPGGITLAHYLIDGQKKTVVLNGRSLERERLLSFQSIIQTAGDFQNVKVPLTSLEKKGASVFSLSFEVKK